MLRVLLLAICAAELAFASPFPITRTLHAPLRRRALSPSQKRIDRRSLFKRGDAMNTTFVYVEGDYVNSFVYDLEAYIGGQGPFLLVADPGSSDTWLVQSGYTCYNLNGTQIDESGCKFGNGTFDPSKSSSYKALNDVFFNVTYNDHETITGPGSTDTFTVAGYNFTQTFGLANYTAWLGDTVSDGLMGLAYPAITDFVNTTTGEETLPNTVPFNIFQQNNVTQIMSIALGRFNETTYTNGGQIAFGETVDVPTTSPMVTVPINKLQLDNTTIKYAFYQTDIFDFKFNGSNYATNCSGLVQSTGYVPLQGSNDTTFNACETTGNAGDVPQAIWDAGTSQMLIPTSIAEQYMKLWQPAYISKDSYQGIYTVDCNSTSIPPLSFNIGGQYFQVPQQDLIYEVNGTCYSNVGDILDDGRTFLMGVAAMFNLRIDYDIGNSSMTLGTKAN